jgi:hypothetical protein
MAKVDTNSIWKRLGRRLAPWFVLLAAFVQIGSAFHHHHDLETHDDCGACVVGHQGSRVDSIQPVEIVLSTGLVEFLALGDGLVPVVQDSPPAAARGPPSSV